MTTESKTHQNDGWQGGKVAAFYPRHARVAFRRQFESTKMTENKINIVVFDSSNALLNSLEISVIDHGIKLIQMVEEIVKDYTYLQNKRMRRCGVLPPPPPPPHQ